jgi:peptidoglycan/LPS O-acetylase OafA/YrhL
MKGLSILWIAFFHFFGTYANGRFPSALDRHYFSPFLQQCAPTSTLETLGCAAKGFYVAVASVGFHAVAVFLILSGFGLTFSLARTGEPDGGWRSWYRGRLLRLFPMYWLAHLIYLVSPFISRPEPVDYRFFLSLLGDRVWPVDTIFYYINPVQACRRCAFGVVGPFGRHGSVSGKLQNLPLAEPHGKAGFTLPMFSCIKIELRAPISYHGV